MSQFQGTQAEKFSLGEGQPFCSIQAFNWWGEALLTLGRTIYFTHSTHVNFIQNLDTLWPNQIDT